MSLSITVIALGASDNGCNRRDAVSTTGISWKKYSSVDVFEGVLSAARTGNSSNRIQDASINILDDFKSVFFNNYRSLYLPKHILIQYPHRTIAG